MADSPNNSTNVCPNCGGKATLKCSRCKNTSYCNADCQRSDWKQHKKTCKVSEVDLDRYIHQAATLLKDIFLIWAEKVYSRKAAKIEKKGTELIIHEVGRGVFVEFPDDLVSGKHEKDTVLSTAMCTQAIAHFRDLFDEMMKVTNCPISELEITMRPSCQSARLSSQPQFWNHTIMAAREPETGRLWILDPTGLQFGNSDAVISYESYVDNFLQTTEMRHEEGFWKSNSQRSKTKPGIMGSIARSEWDATAVVYSTLKKWKETSGYSYPKLLREPGILFQEQRKALLAEVEEQLASFVTARTVNKDAQAELAEPGGSMKREVLQA